MKTIHEYDNGLNGYWDLKNHSWSGAIDTLQTIEDIDMQNNRYEFEKQLLRYKLMELLDDIFQSPVDETTVNDFIWFERDFIYEQLGIKEEE